MACLHMIDRTWRSCHVYKAQQTLSRPRKSLSEWRKSFFIFCLESLTPDVTPGQRCWSKWLADFPPPFTTHPSLFPLWKITTRWKYFLFSQQLWWREGRNGAIFWFYEIHWGRGGLVRLNVELFILFFLLVCFPPTQGKYICKCM